MAGKHGPPHAPASFVSIRGRSVAPRERSSQAPKVRAACGYDGNDTTSRRAGLGRGTPDALRQRGAHLHPVRDRHRVVGRHRYDTSNRRFAAGRRPMVCGSRTSAARALGVVAAGCTSRCRLPTENSGTTVAFLQQRQGQLRFHWTSWQLTPDRIPRDSVTARSRRSRPSRPRRPAIHRGRCSFPPSGGVRVSRRGFLLIAPHCVYVTTVLPATSR